MWASLEEEMLQKAQTLLEYGYVSTSKWCEHICKNIGQYTRFPQMFNNDIEDLVQTFKHEYLSRTDFGNRKLREAYLEIVQKSLENAIRNSPNPKQMFTDLIPLMQRMNNTGRVTSEMVEVFSKINEKLVEARICGSLFVFMLHLEGEYFPIIQTLCALKVAGEGKDVDLEVIRKKKVDCMKRELGDFSISLFTAYNEVGRKLRNAIAHANFRFEGKKLICWNIDSKTHIETWRRDFTYEELSATLVDIYSLSHAYICWYILRELMDKVAHHEKLHFVFKSF